MMSRFVSLPFKFETHGGRVSANVMVLGTLGWLVYVQNERINVKHWPVVQLCTTFDDLLRFLASPKIDCGFFDWRLGRTCMLSQNDDFFCYLYSLFVTFGNKARNLQRHLRVYFYFVEAFFRRAGDDPGEFGDNLGRLLDSSTTQPS